MAAVLVGLAAGLVCYCGVLLKDRLHYDDTLDAFGIHGIGGVIGMLLLGVFAQKLWNPAGADGLLTGSHTFLMHQLVAVLATAGWSCVATLGLLKLVDMLVGLRVQSDVEREGLDVNLHGEVGYAIGSTIAGHSVFEVREVEPEAAALETA
jgi:Amt family ammonium transporter